MSHPRPFMHRMEGTGRLITCLLLAASSACGDGGRAEPRARTVDVRFRGVGLEQSAVSSVGGTGAPMPGLGNESAEWHGPGFMAWGLVAPDFMSVHGTRIPGDDRVRYVRQWWNGLDCPTSLDAALASNSVVLGIGGDPHVPNATCTIFGVGPDDSDPVEYEYLIGSSQSAAEIEAAFDADEKARSFVLTAITRVGDNRYTFVAESVGAVDGRYEQFHTVVRSVPLSELEGLAESLAASGYIITASSWDGGPEYALVGTRERSGGPSRSIQILLSDPGQFTEDVGRLLVDGYSPVSVTMGRVGDGIVVRVIGER